MNTRVSKRQLGRGWIAVNFSAGEERNLRKLAKAAGLKFRGVCENALRSAARELAKDVGLEYPFEIKVFSPQEIKALAERSWLLRSLPMGRRHELN